MSGFRASNGVEIRAAGNGLRIFDRGHNTLDDTDYLDARDTAALREFFDHERQASHVPHTPHP